MSIILYDIYYYDLIAAQEKVLRISTDRYITFKVDDPSAFPYEVRVVEGGGIERHLLGAGKTRGSGELAFGEFVLSNTDGKLDYLLEAGFAGRRIIVRYVDSIDTPLSESMLVSTLVIDEAEFTWDRLTFSVRDPLFDLDTPSLSAQFLGTNTDKYGYEGTVNDVKGQYKPFVYGEARTLVPALGNVISLMFFVNFDIEGNPIKVFSITDVRLNYKGSAIFLDTSVGNQGNCANLTDLANANIAPGCYALCLSKGAIRFNNLSSSDIVTVTVVEGDSPADRTVAQIVRRFIRDRTSKSDADMLLDSFTDLDNVQSNTFGIYVDTPRSTLECLYELLEGAGASIIPQEQGRLEVIRLEAPLIIDSLREFVPEDWITEASSGLEMIPSADEGGGIPAWKVITGAQKINRYFSETEFAGDTTAAEREYAKQEYHNVEASDANILIAHPRAPQIEIKSLMVSLTSAAVENQRQLDLRKEQRQFWRLTVGEPVLYNLGKTVTLKANRFNFKDGKPFKVIGYSSSFTDIKTSYYLWG